MNSDKKKRLIIPVATLMVAIVMMAGVGYAAVSSTFTVNENSTVGGEFKVTVDGYDDTNKLFKNVKIPYGVETKNGSVVANTVYADDYVLVDGKTVKVTDDTGLNKAYTVTVEATSIKITELGENYTLSAILLKTGGVASGSTDTYTGNQTFTLKVVLKVSDGTTISDPANLNVEDIIVKISATHTA